MNPLASGVVQREHVVTGILDGEWTEQTSYVVWPNTCNTFWGSHGCAKAKGHVEAGDPIHVCDPDDGTYHSLCSENDGTHARFWGWDEDDIMSLGDPVEYPVFH